jgi:mRNA interferase MazF
VDRGEVWWTELEGDAGFRPVAIVSRSEAIERRQNVTIVEITRIVRSLPSKVALSRADGMPTECVINTDNLHTIPKASLRERITKLGSDHLFALSNSLKYSLELDW